MPEIDLATWDAGSARSTRDCWNLDNPIIRAVDHHYVWTECSDAAGGWVAINGFRLVNRNGYWLTERPWNDGEQWLVRVADLSPDDEEENGCG
jgi:hypothetical protein